MPDVVMLDDALPAEQHRRLRDEVLASKLVGGSPLGGTFLATRGFSITFHASSTAAVTSRFPFVAPYLALVVDKLPAREVQRRPLLGGPPVPNAMYMNVLVVPPGAAVGRHVDATLGPPSGSVIPEAVAVLYLDVPDDLTGGRLLLVDGDGAGEREIERVVPKNNRFVVFAGRLGHEVEAVTASRPRVSIVCEQYALSPGVLSTVPKLRVHSRSAFGAVLDDVRSRSR